jgi:hypothetical protein
MARFVLVQGAFSGAWIWGPLSPSRVRGDQPRKGAFRPSVKGNERKRKVFGVFGGRRADCDA